MTPKMIAMQAEEIRKNRTTTLIITICSAIFFLAFAVAATILKDNEAFNLLAALTVLLAITTIISLVIHLNLRQKYKNTVDLLAKMFAEQVAKKYLKKEE